MSYVCSCGERYESAERRADCEARLHADADCPRCKELEAALWAAGMMCTHKGCPRLAVYRSPAVCERHATVVIPHPQIREKALQLRSLIDAWSNDDPEQQAQTLDAIEAAGLLKF